MAWWTGRALTPRFKFSHLHLPNLRRAQTPTCRMHAHTQRVAEGSVDLVIDIQCFHIFPSLEERRRVADLICR